MAIELVNSISANNAASASTLETGSALAVEPQNLIVIVASIGLGTATLLRVTDDKGGNTYQLAVGLNGVITADLEIWYGIAIDGDNLKWKAEWSTAAVNQRIAVLQYRGGCGPLDQTSTGSAAAGATTLSAGAITTTVANEVIVGGFVYTVAQTLTAGGSFTNQETEPATPDTVAQDRIVAATGTYEAQGTVSTPTGYLAAVASFKQADVIAVKQNKFALRVG